MEPRKASWLCPTDLDRARVVENTARVARARTIASVAVGAGLLVFAPIFGWWTLALFALSALNTQTLDRRVARSARPEWHVAFSIGWSQALMASAAALSGGPTSPALAWLALPTAFAATRFRGRVVVVAVAGAVVMMVAATFGVDPQGTVDHPVNFATALILLVGITACVSALSGAEVEHRSGSILDPLTGLLNRSGLARRFEELSEQAALTDEPISLLVCDLDRFKLVNDVHGHARGDVVLRDIAYLLRKQLRSFELIYRLGGEEFLIVLPGADRAAALAVAERVRHAIEHGRPGGLETTVSIGASTAEGKAASFKELFAAADEALYSAKAAGRNRVRSRIELTPVPAPGLS